MNRDNLIAVGEYYGEDGLQEFIKYVKKGDSYVIALLAYKMRLLLPEDCSNICLVPVPSHIGRVTRNRDLVIAIASGFQRDKMPIIMEAIGCDGSTIPWYLMKKKGCMEPPRMFKKDSIPEQYRVIFVDDVVATGLTWYSCSMALGGRGEMLCAAIDSETFNQYNNGTQAG